MCYYVYLLYLGANCHSYHLCVCVSFIPVLHVDSENPLPLFVSLLGFAFGLYFFFRMLSPKVCWSLAVLSNLRLREI